MPESHKRLKLVHFCAFHDMDTTSPIQIPGFNKESKYVLGLVEQQNGGLQLL